MEDDDDVAESWEEAADSGEIERRLEAKLKISRNAEKTASSSPMRTAIVIQDESLPAAPPPQIRILKRPTSNGSAGSSSSFSRPSQHMKSLAQREAEYAKARLRILGSSSSEETQEKNNLESRPVRVDAQPPSEAAGSNSHVIRQPIGPDDTIGFRHYR